MRGKVSKHIQGSAPANAISALTKGISAADIAELLALHWEGDTSASNYLRALGVTLPEPQHTLAEAESEPLTPIKNTAATNSQQRPDYLPEVLFDFPMWAVTKLEQAPSEDDDNLLTGDVYCAADEQPSADYPPLEKPSIEPVAITVKRVQQQLRAPLQGEQLAIRPIVKAIAQHQILPYLPKQVEPFETKQLMIYIDGGRANAGMMFDGLAVATAIAKHMPHTQSNIVWLRNGPHSEWQWANSGVQRSANHRHSGSQQQRGWQHSPLPLPAPNACCLIISATCNASTQHGWHRQLQHLQQHKVRCFWLACYSQKALFAQRHSALKHTQFIAWGSAGAASAEHAALFRQGQQQLANDVQSASHSNARALQLLTAIMLSVRLVSGKLLRRFLHTFGLAPSIEAQFWQQTHVYFEAANDCGFVQLSAEQKTVYQQYLQQLSPATLHAFSTEIERVLRSESNAQLHEHRLHLALLTKGHQWQHPKLASSEAFFNALGVNMQQTGENTCGNALFLQETIAQFDGYIQQANNKVQQTLAIANAYCLQQGITQQLNGALAERAQRYMGRNDSVRQTLKVYQKGDTLHCYLADAIANNPSLQHTLSDCALVAELQHSTASVPLLIAGKQSIPVNQSITLSKLLGNADHTQLYSQYSQLHLQRLTTEHLYWASNISVTEIGVIAETATLCIIWPSKPLDNRTIEQALAEKGKHWKKDNYSQAMIGIKHSAPAWLNTVELALDEHGLYCTVSVRTERFNLRYIPPGHFLMGSPEGEPERESGDDACCKELQHPVQLSQGFWLGETTVSQQLWQVITGENPSHFTAENNERLPVEQVSWDDCQRFCQQLSEHTDITLGLPTEAQWEYACRAGTTTPFSMGLQLTTQLANFNGNHPYHNGEGLNPQEKAQLENREKTVDIHRFKANAWGVKQMHGNVWEWCADSPRQFAAEQVLDPVGASELRALRGGSWYDFGGYCRSAYRIGYGNVGRYIDVGLRLQGLDAEPASEPSLQAKGPRSGPISAGKESVRDDIAMSFNELMKSLKVKKI